MAKFKFTERKATVADAISGAVSDLTGLGEECREAYDNMPESLQGGQRGSTLDETANTLEDLQEPDVPEVLGALECSWRDAAPNRKGRSPSRATRRDNAVSAIDAAISKVEEWRDDWDAAKEALEEGDASAEQQKFVEGLLGDQPANGELIVARAALAQGVASADAQKLVHSQYLGEDPVDLPDFETLIDELTEIKDSAEGCEFPGMYG